MSDPNGQFDRPQGLVTDGLGHIFMAEAQLGQVFVFDQITGAVVKKLGSFGEGPGQLELPLDLVLDSKSGDLSVTDRAALIGALQAQNAVTPAGVVQTEDEKMLVRVSGAFQSEEDILAVNFVANGHIIRLGDIGRVTRGPADPAQPIFRVNGKPAIGLAIAMRDAGDILALGDNLRREMAEITASLPVGIEPTLVADQAVTVDHAINDFMTSLWQAIVIILACSFVSLGVRPGTVVALAIPLTMAVVFALMNVADIHLHRIS